MFSEMKTRDRDEARRLRREEGRSVKEIERLLGVSRSTASIWVRDIPLTDAQRASLKRRNPIYNGQFAGAAANAERGRTRRLAYQEQGRLRAKECGPLYVAGCMLYWGEGAKSRNYAALSNADPEVLRLFGRFMRECFGVADLRMRVTCHLFADHISKQREVEQFWLDGLGLPQACLRKSVVNRYSRSSQRKRFNRLPYGTCKVVVYSTEIVQMIYGSIQEFAGFNRAAWLDC